ncbi:hypothetical protein INT45_005060, partial [Circinella minor]
FFSTAFAELQFSKQWPFSPFQHSVAKQQQQPIVQETEFRVLKNERVKNYAVRIKQPQSCENSLQYSGYIDNHETDDHLFFWFFESRTSPETDPFVLWLNGGPGCSSMMGNWMELGPCQVHSSGNSTVHNEYSWNTAANIVFLDQPVNVGYSYGKSKIADTKHAARDVAAFLQLFLFEFKKYADNPLHIAGESYGGHYLPALSVELLQQNKIAAKGHIHIPYESMIIGNGWTDPRTQYKHYETYSCANNSEYEPLFDEKICKKMRDTYPRCEKLMTTCYEQQLPLTCIPAELYCIKTQQSIFYESGLNLNPYDIRKTCAGESGLCYAEIDSITKYANSMKVRRELGVDDAARKFSSCTDSVAEQFEKTADHGFSFAKHVADTLNSGIRVLLYAGDMDWRCNWIGNRAWSLKMEWSGQQGYREALGEPWCNSKTGGLAGKVWSHSRLTFLQVFNAGHMVPYDQPENALDFFNRWLQNKALNSI